MRGVAAILVRLSGGLPRKLAPSIQLPFQGSDMIAKHIGFQSLTCGGLQSAVAGSNFLLRDLEERTHQCLPHVIVRKISSSTVVCMGRRSCKIAGRKESQNAKKMKICSKIGKQVVSAIKKGGPNASSNSLLAAVLDKAKELDVPRDILERNIKRASEKGQDAYIEKVYEVYGFGGVCMVVEVLTDKITRSIAAVRSVVKDCGGKMADPGSVMFKFKHAHVVNVKVSDVEKDQLLSVALDSGAEDVIEPSTYNDYSDPAEADNESTENMSESYYTVVCSSENYAAIISKLREEGIKFETDSGVELLPVVTVEVDDESARLNREMISKLLELEDVDAVYTDQK